VFRGRITMPTDDKIPVSKRKKFMGKVLFFSVLIALSLAMVILSHCSKDAEETAVRAQQMKNDSKMVEIDKRTWKQTTFYDENERCWNIYTHTDSRGKAVFATPCVGVK
jgi:hypothetical protein